MWAPRRASRRRATRTAAAWTWSRTSCGSRACAACGWAPRLVWCASLWRPCQASHAATLYAREPRHARQRELLPATSSTACLPLQKLWMSTRPFSSLTAPPPQQHMREATRDNYLPDPGSPYLPAYSGTCVPYVRAGNLCRRTSLGKRRTSAVQARAAMLRSVLCAVHNTSTRG